MGALDTVRTMRRFYPNNVIFVKVRKVYRVFDNDVYILSYIFNYKVKTEENNINVSDFSEAALNKIVTKLNDMKINYLIIDMHAGNDIFKRADFKEKNKYQNFASKFKDKLHKSSSVSVYDYLINEYGDES